MELIELLSVKIRKDDCVIKVRNYILTFIMLFLTFYSSAQINLNGRFYVNGVDGTPTLPTSQFSIQGEFTDPTMTFSADDVIVGDMIADNSGLIYRIDKITEHTQYSKTIKVDVSYISGAVDIYSTYPTNFANGTLFRPSSNGFPLLTYDSENSNDIQKIAIQNAAILAIDQSISGFTSGTAFPVTDKLGAGFYNTTEKKLYIYNGSSWIPVGSGTVPSGTSTEFPNPATKGDMFFNTEDNSSYIYNGTIWLKISTNGSVPSGIFNPDPATVTITEGSLFYNNSDHKLYVYNGTVWMPADNTLPIGQIYVGNSTNVATPVTMSGDATINNSGKLTVVNKAITDDKLDKTHIPLSGFANPTDNVSFGDGTTNNRVVNLANPTGAQDAATKNYVDALFTNPTALLTLPSGNFFVGNITNKAVATTKSTIPISGFGSATANISLGDGTTNNKIVNLANPLVAQDAATKNYVDTRIIDPASITLATGSLLLGNATGKAGAVAKNAIAISGFGAATSDLAFGGFKLMNVSDPAAAQDVATKNYVDTKTIDASSLNLASGSMFLGNASGKAISTLKTAIPLSGFGTAAADISFGNYKLTNLATPLGDNDAATKKYIDDLFATPSTSLALATGKMFLGNATGKAVATSTITIPVSSFGKATATINMGDAATQYNISFLAEPLFAQDAATKSYVDSKIAGPGALTLSAGSIYVGNASNQATDVPKSNIPISDFGIATTDISLGNGTANFKITNLADPTTDQEAATKKYVDAKTASTQSGGTLPSTGQQVSDTYYSTADNRLYVYNGTSWVPVDNSLANGQLYVGNASGIATATAKNTIPLSGFASAGADVAFGNGILNYKITNLADPTNDQEAATKKYVDTKTSAAGSLALPLGSIFVGSASNLATPVAKNTVSISDFGAASAGILLGNGTTNFKISNLADPTADQEAATKKYVDAKSVSTQTGGTLPAVGQMGDTFYSTSDNRLYVYTGSAWQPVGNALADGQFFVGSVTGIATAATKSSIPISGFGTATANISLGNGTNNFKITNLLDPTADQEAATKKYVDAKTATTQNGGTLPATGQMGDTFYSTADNRLYTYNGTTWVAVGADNLGNHTATTNLKMQTFSISNGGGVGAGLSFDATENAVIAKDLTVNGNFYTPSDRRLKTNIETLTTVLKSIDQIRGVRFEYKNQRKYATGPKIGVIAQELQTVFPEMVNLGKDGFLKVDYTQLTGVLIQAIKEQQNEINLQQLEIKNLKDRMNNQQQQIDAILKKLQ